MANAADRGNCVRLRRSVPAKIMLAVLIEMGIHYELMAPLKFATIDLNFNRVLVPIFSLLNSSQTLFWR